METRRSSEGAVALFAQRSSIDESHRQSGNSNVILFGYEIYGETDVMTIPLEQSQGLQQQRLIRQRGTFLIEGPFFICLTKPLLKEATVAALPGQTLLSVCASQCAALVRCSDF